MPDLIKELADLIKEPLGHLAMIIIFAFITAILAMVPSAVPSSLPSISTLVNTFVIGFGFIDATLLVTGVLRLLGIIAPIVTGNA